MLKQKLDEFNQLLDIIDSRDVQNTLEIGTFQGESAEIFSNHVYGIVVTVDPFLSKSFPKRIKLIKGFSLDEKTILQVKQYAPFGFIFIDGDHRLAYQDFLTYKSMIKEGGIIAFHDINPNCNLATCSTLPAWEKIKKDYPHIEIISKTDLRKGYGIGVIFS